MLGIIQVNGNDVIYEIHKSVAQNLGNLSNKNRSSKIRPLIFISFFVTNRSDYFEQFTIIMKMIQITLNYTKANNIVNTLFRLKIKYNLREKIKKVKKK